MKSCFFHGVPNQISHYYFFGIVHCAISPKWITFFILTQYGMATVEWKSSGIIGEMDDIHIVFYLSTSLNVPVCWCSWGGMACVHS